MRTIRQRRCRVPGKRWPAVSCATLACTLVGLDARADDRWFDWTVGAGTSYESELYLDSGGQSQDPDTQLELYLELSVGPLSVSPIGASLTVFEWAGASRLTDDGLSADSRWELAADLFLDAGTGHRDQGEDTIFVGMETRTDDTLIGFEVDWVTPVGLISAGAGTATGDGSGGQSTTFAWGLPLWSGAHVEVFGDVGIAWLSSDLVRYDYGVHGNEVQVGRPLWEPGAALVPRAGLGADYAILSHWSLFGILDLSIRPGEIRDSPLTSDEREDFLIEIGVLYSSD